MDIREEFSLSKQQLNEWITLESNSHYVITARVIVGHLACFLLYEKSDTPITYRQYAVLNESGKTISQGATDGYGYLLCENIPSGEYLLEIEDCTCRVSTHDDEDDEPHQLRMEGLRAPETETITDDDIQQELFEDSETEGNS